MVQNPVDVKSEIAVENDDRLEAASKMTTESVKIVSEPTISSNNESESLQQVDRYASESTIRAQVTSVSQLSDVRPTDWAFQALQSLVERYGCIAGYPDKRLAF